MAPPPRPAPQPAPDLGGATQYVSVGGARGTLVGVLACIEGSLVGELFKLHDGENTLGREGTDVRMSSRRISRNHARIQHQEGVFVIEAHPEVMDKNPTFLNDDEIDAEALSDGDTIKLGDCTFRFRTI